MSELTHNFSLDGNIFKKNESEGTLDEPISTTIKRDLLLIYKKIYYLVSNNEKGSDRINDLQMLHNWELWGPSLFLLTLSMCLYLKAPSESKDNIFSTIYFISVYGGISATVNTLILSTKPSFFAIISLIGYCIFPLAVTSLISLFFPYFFIMLVFVTISNVYIFRIIANLVGNITPEEKRFVVFYPISLFFIAITFLILIH